MSARTPATLRMRKCRPRAQPPVNPPEISLHLAPPCLVSAQPRRASRLAALEISSFILTFPVFSLVPLTVATSRSSQACCAMDLPASPTLPVTSVLKWWRVLLLTSPTPHGVPLPHPSWGLLGGLQPSHLGVILQLLTYSLLCSFAQLVDILSYCLIVQIY